MSGSLRRFASTSILAALALGAAVVSPADGAPAQPYAGHVTSATVQTLHADRGSGHPLMMWSDGVTSNVSDVFNGGQGHLKARTRMALVSTKDGVVSATNRAVAESQCSNCRTASVAVEVVLASERPSSLDFANTAFALNTGCQHCEALAMAYQLAVVAPGIRLSDRGVAELRDINGRLGDVVVADESLDAVADAVKALVAEAVSVLDAELTTTGADSRGRGRSRAPSVSVHSAVHRT
ncbi:MAG TPA: hypothetical protein VFJ22_16005 [Dermatophilaceae bacterium]|nr:hypothetical protein [Dermatophilaceae bacterium]